MNLDLLNSIITFATEEGHLFNWKNVVYQALNLLILLLVLVYYLKQPIKNFLIERRGIIGNEIDDAQKALAEARKIKDEYEEKLGNIENEIKSLKESIGRQGEIEREEILKQARIASEKIKKEATETIKLETAKAHREIQTKAVSIAIEIAQDLIKKGMTEPDKSKLIEDFISRIDEEKWRRLQH